MLLSSDPAFALPSDLCEHQEVRQHTRIAQAAADSACLLAQATKLKVRLVLQKGQLRSMLLALVEQIASFRPADVMDVRLEGKLMLTAALLRSLGRAALEDFRSTLAGPLVVRLLTGVA